MPKKVIEFIENVNLEKEQKTRSPERIDFNDGRYTNISSTAPLTDEEWVGIKNKLITAINTLAASSNNNTLDCNYLFKDNHIPIELVATSVYSYYNIAGTTPSSTIQLNANFVKNADNSDLLEWVTKAINATFGDGSTPRQS